MFSLETFTHQALIKYQDQYEHIEPCLQKATQEAGGERYSSNDLGKDEFVSSFSERVCRGRGFLLTEHTKEP